jgi:hypothetical protein
MGSAAQKSDARAKWIRPVERRRDQEQPSVLVLPALVAPALVLRDHPGLLAWQDFPATSGVVQGGLELWEACQYPAAMQRALQNVADDIQPFLRCQAAIPRVESDAP